MARLAKHKVHAALDKAAANILSAAGDDPIVSRKDIRQKLMELEGVEQQLTDVFYRFMDHRDYKPGARITKKDIDETLAYAKEKLIDIYDKNNNGLSAAEIAEMSLTARLAVRYAKLQDQLAAEAPTADNLYKSLAELGEGLYFPAWANEAEAYLSPFRQDAKLQELTEESFSSALGLDYADPTEAIELWHQGRAAYDWVFELYEHYDQLAALESFKTLHKFMEKHLTHITHIVVGLDGSHPDSEYPVYFVGLSAEGHILGFKTSTVWT
ncbi:MAG TPA: nuclease A inhibitor family protein [Phaeodactylibacter sp.]|nr:nuclease A inhibitor family protein [Phaeodactylibacter sp.]